jgi:hypothetical protein
MSRPLRSARITRASPLLRAGPPARPQRYSAPRRFSGLMRSLSLPHPRGRSISARLPVFPHASRRPGSRHLHAGHRLASNTGFRQAYPGTGIIAPVPMPFHPLDASAVVHSRSPSRSPPDSSRLPFPHRSVPQSSARAPCGGLTPPPAGRRRRATKPSSCVQQAHRVIASYSGDSFPRTRRKTPGILGV